MQSPRSWMKSILAFSLVFFLSVGIFGLSGCGAKNETNEASVDGDDEVTSPITHTDWPFDADEALRRQEETAEALDIPVEYENEIGIKFRLIPAGEFMMGSPEDEVGRVQNESLHQIVIEKPFYLSVYEVTRSEWEDVIGVMTHQREHFDAQDTDCPITWISWKDAQEFCRRLSSQSDRDYRLPSEAEWEYSCRAGSATAYCFGDSYSNLGEYALYDEEGPPELRWRPLGTPRAQGEPEEVGLRKANAWGIHGMHGNVCEFCQDLNSSLHEPAIPVVPAEPPPRDRGVVRGGSWMGNAVGCRSARRNSVNKSGRGNAIGFRIVCEVR
jgi:formylglycine-generating enzyme required for sulfatase activity